MAFITDQNAQDICTWSGSLFFARQHLQAQGVTLVEINIAHFLPSAIGQSIIMHPHKGPDSLWHMLSPTTQDFVARQVAFRLQLEPVDVIVSHGVFGVAKLQHRQPLIYWEDMPSGLLSETYPKYAGVDPDILQDWRQLEEETFRHTDAWVFPSQWASDWTQAAFSLPSERVHTLPFGANLSILPREAVMTFFLEQRLKDTRCRLLFVGKDWNRKGGELVFEIAELLVKHDLLDELVLVGGRPKGELPSYVRHVSVNKDNPSSLQELLRLYATSHFLIVPSTAEGYGVVFCEAASFGLPSVSRAVGGITSAVADGLTGKLFESQAQAQDYANWIRHLWQDKNAYSILSRNAFNYAKQTLNWTRFAQDFVDLATQLIENQRNQNARLS